jgi:hypothetical protein
MKQRNEKYGQEEAFVSANLQLAEKFERGSDKQSATCYDVALELKAPSQIQGTSDKL